MGFEQITTEFWSRSNGHHRRGRRRRVYITKTNPYHQPTTTFPFPPPRPHPPTGTIRQNPAQEFLYSSLRVTPPPFSKPFFKSVGINSIRNQTKGDP